MSKHLLSLSKDTVIYLVSIYSLVEIVFLPKFKKNADLPWVEIHPK